MAAGIPQERTAWGLNQLCGSGLRAVALGMQQIANGDADVIVAGGQENMSRAPHVAHLRDGTKMGDLKFVDTRCSRTACWDAFHGYHMGSTAENVAAKWQITREEQDAFAVGSQNKAEAAQKAGKFKDEIAPVTVNDPQGRHRRRSGRIHPPRRHARGHRRSCALPSPRTAPSPPANASGINDGAAAAGADDAPTKAKRRGIDAAGPHRLLGHARRRSRDHGHGPDPGLDARPWKRRAGRSAISISSRPTRPSPRRPSPVNKDHGLGPGDRERQWRRDRHRPSRSAPRARAFSTRCCYEMQRRDAEEGPGDALHRRRHGRRRSASSADRRNSTRGSEPRVFERQNHSGTAFVRGDIPWLGLHWLRAAQPRHWRRHLEGA